jgi:hypothetical protein
VTGSFIMETGCGSKCVETTGRDTPAPFCSSNKPYTPPPKPDGFYKPWEPFFGGVNIPRSAPRRVEPESTDGFPLNAFPQRSKPWEE